MLLQSLWQRLKYTDKQGAPQCNSAAICSGFYMQCLSLKYLFSPNDPFMWCGSIPAIPPNGPSPPAPIGNWVEHKEEDDKAIATAREAVTLTSQSCCSHTRRATAMRNGSHLVGLRLGGLCLSSCTCCRQSWSNLGTAVDKERRQWAVKQCGWIWRNPKSRTCRTWHDGSPRWPTSTAPWRSLRVQF